MNIQHILNLSSYYKTMFLFNICVFITVSNAAIIANCTDANLNIDFTVVLKLLLIYICIIRFLGILALFGTPVSGDVYAWVAVFVLPVNSALNPFLYTLSAIIKKKVYPLYMCLN